MSKAFPIYLIAGLVGLMAIYSGFSDKRVLFISDARTAVITLAAAGFVMCTTGLIGAFVTKAPAHPLTILGYILGLLAIFAAVVQIFGLKVPYLSVPKNGLTFITAVIIIKIIIARLNFIIK